MIGEPRIENRSEQPTLGIRNRVEMDQLPAVIPAQIGEVFGWMQQNGVAPAGAPFARYHLVNMPGILEVEVGWPVAASSTGNGRITPGVIQAGRYATLVYTGNYPGLPEATGALLDWGATQGLVWDAKSTSEGKRFGARLESYLTNPAEEPDLEKHETEIVIRLAE